MSQTTLPANLDAERLILGSIVLDDVLYVSAAETLSADDFSLEKHRRIWVRMGEIHIRGERVDHLTLAEELKRHGELESVGLGYLASLTDGLPKILNIESYTRIVKEKSARRRIILACNNLMSRCSLSGEDLMICNMQEGMCIAGVFGGIESGITESSVNVFLESAHFSPVYIRKTSKRHLLNTDASFRFERGSDPNITAYALKRFAERRTKALNPGDASPGWPRACQRPGGSIRDLADYDPERP
jgi:hypothetical protein